MRYRDFGRTGLRVSELSFGGWAIGGRSFGAVARKDALAALARAEELGVNFVDTAEVYGESEAILGEFLQGRRDRWIVASKYSGQEEGMTALVERQLKTLRTDRIDFYQLHWTPTDPGHPLYQELRDLKASGKVRFTGVSLYTENEIDFVLSESDLDGFQVPFGLMDPRPLLHRVAEVGQKELAVVARSCLKDGFLTGKYSADSTFSDPSDHRSEWSRARIARTAAAADRFRFLEEEAGSLLNAAVSYPLGFDEVSTVVLSTKNVEQAAANYGALEPVDFSNTARARIEEVQDDLGLLRDPLLARLRDRLTAPLRWLRRQVG